MSVALSKIHSEKTPIFLLFFVPEAHSRPAIKMRRVKITSNDLYSSGSSDDDSASSSGSSASSAGHPRTIKAPVDVIDHPRAARGRPTPTKRLEDVEPR